MKEKYSNDFKLDGQKQPEVDPGAAKRRWTNFMLLGVVILISTVGIYTSFFSDKSPVQIIHNIVRKAPVITAKDLHNYCNSGKPVKIELFTGEGVTGKSGTKYAYERLLGQTRHRRSWEVILFESSPKQVILYSADHKPVLSVESDTIDEDFLRLLYDGPLDQVAKADVPAAWIKKAHEGDRFTAKMLAANSPVAVIGAISGKPGHYQLTAFDSMDGRTDWFPPIVCASSLEKVLASLR